MSQLKEFSPKTHDEGHLRVGVPVEAARFFEDAKISLEKLVRPVMNEIIPSLDRLSGKWHPLGFMVYHLGVDKHGQSLRLHIWPEGGRPTSERGPHIHNHAWDLASFVLAGTYSDSIQRVANSNFTEDDGSEVLRPFKLRYKTDGLDTFDTDGTLCTVERVEERIRVEGETHEIPHGVFHIPTIPTDQLTATLVLDSLSYGYDTTVMIVGEKRPFQVQRRPITPEEARRATEQLL
ncbi:MAG: hypothetical protein WBC38_01530 [Microgenomates group bacterium]|nr:MAG: hypothetical protein IPH70_03380 [Candidatus Roizmanbacteria bacterium]